MPAPTILETNESGELQIPGGLLGAGPRARFRLEHDGETVRLVPEPAQLANPIPPDQRARAFRDWVDHLPKRTGSPLPAEALRRENFYD